VIKNDENILTLDDLMTFIRIRNESFITVQICDENGHFFIYDRNTENIFEKGRELMRKSTIFDLMIPISTEYLAF